MTMHEMCAMKDVPVVRVDAQGRMIFVNEEFCRVFGWSMNEALAGELAMIIPQNLRDAHNMGFSRFLASEKATLMHQKLNLKAINKQGDVFDAEHFIIAEKIEGRWEFAATIKPI